MSTLKYGLTGAYFRKETLIFGLEHCWDIFLLSKCYNNLIYNREKHSMWWINLKMSCNPSIFSWQTLYTKCCKYTVVTKRTGCSWWAICLPRSNWGNTKNGMFLSVWFYLAEYIGSNFTGRVMQSIDVNTTNGQRAKKSHLPFTRKGHLFIFVLYRPIRHSLHK